MPDLVFRDHHHKVTVCRPPSRTPAEPGNSPFEGLEKARAGCILKTQRHWKQLRMISENVGSGRGPTGQQLIDLLDRSPVAPSVMVDGGLPLCDPEAAAGHDRCLVCTGIGWLAHSASLLLETDHGDHRASVMRDVFDRFFGDCRAATGKEKPWWRGDQELTAFAHQAVREAITNDADAASVIEAGFTDWSQQTETGQEELLFEWEVLRGSWFATVLHCSAYLSAAGPVTAPSPRAEPDPWKRITPDMHGDRVVYEHLSLYFGWYHMASLGGDAEPDEVRQLAALIDLYACLSDYGDDGALMSGALRARIAEKADDLAERLPAESGRTLRQLCHRNQPLRHAFQLRSLADAAWTRRGPESELTAAGIRLTKETAIMCNVIEWGPLPWLGSGIASNRSRLLLSALAKVIADVYDQFIEQSESGNTARHLGADIGLVFAVRALIIADPEWPFRHLLVGTELYELLGERHRLAERLAGGRTGRDFGLFPSVFATWGEAPQDLWQACLQQLERCPAHRATPESAAHFDGEDWTRPEIIVQIRRWLHGIIRTTCRDRCVRAATTAVHCGLVSSGSIDRILAANSAALSAPGARPVSA